MFGELEVEDLLLTRELESDAKWVGSRLFNQKMQVSCKL